jgi:hypothetical protein
VPFIPDFVVDDHEGVVEAFGGYHIPFKVLDGDREMLNVLEAIEHVASIAGAQPQATAVTDEGQTS